jgi:hypothetical protein
MLGPHLVALFWEVVGTLELSWLEEVGHWGLHLKVTLGPSLFPFLFPSHDVKCSALHALPTMMD